MTTKSKPGKHDGIPTAVITIGAPLVLSNPPKGRSITPPAISREKTKKKNGLLPPYPHYPSKGAEAERSSSSDKSSDQNLQDLANAVHNIVVQLDVVPRLLGPHPLPSYIMESMIGKVVHQLMSVGVHRETYRPFGHFYTLREPQTTNRGFEFTFGDAGEGGDDTDSIHDDEDADGRRNGPLLAYVNDPVNELLSKFANNVADLLYGIHRDHLLEVHSTKSMKRALKQATARAALKAAECESPSS
jgi:hypothetical protein